MDDSLVSPLVITGLGFLLGWVFGYVGNRTNFCAMGAVSDIVNFSDWTRMRMWTLAMAVAILGVAVLQLSAQIDVGRSIYAGATVPWLSHVIGGLMFGVGMSLASGCTSKTLIRIGGGNLKSLVVFLVLAVSAYMTLKGLFGVWRARLLDPVTLQFDSPQTLGALLAAPLGLDVAQTAILVPLAIGAALLLFSLSSAAGRKGEVLFGGIVIGLVVVAGWYVTGHVGFVAEHPETLEPAWIATNGNRPESLSLVAPYAYSLELMMFWSDSSRHVTFGIATAIGIVVGSLTYALLSRTYREETFPDATDLKRHILGGVLMGAGGITALGCTVGQGLTGVSTLALGSFITTAAIIIGSAIMIKIDYWRIMREA